MPIIPDLPTVPPAPEWGGVSAPGIRSACAVALAPPAWRVLAIVAVFAGGCVATGPVQWLRNGCKVGPNYAAPPAAVAPEWIEANDPRLRGAPPRDGDWWHGFQDPSLDSLICRAYRENPNLRAIGTRVFQARAQQGIAVGNFFPQTQQVQSIYAYGTAVGAPTHIDLTAFNLSWELDFWGKYRRQVESASAKLDASLGDYDDALVTLLADVATNYVQYRVAQQRLKIAEANLKRQQGLVAIAARQQKIGTANTRDVAQLRTLMEQTSSTIPSLRIAQGQANDRLCILTGEPPRDLVEELGPGPELSALPLPAIPDAAAAGIPADLLRRRPDVRSAERQVAAQTAQIGVAEAAFYPSLSVGSTLGYVDLSLGSLVSPGRPLSSAGGLAFLTPQFSWPILNYGRIANNVRAQDAHTQELIATYQNKVLTAAQEVQTALRGFLRSQEQADALGRSVAAAMTAISVEEKLFNEVKADVNRLFTLENSVLQAQDQLAVARGNVALYLINVYRALGGGWELRLHEERCACEPPAAAGVDGAGRSLP